MLTLFNNSDINNMSELEQWRYIKRKAYYYPHITNPSKHLQYAMVILNAMAIQYIDSPSPEIQYQSVRKNAYAIVYITNPSERIQLVALENGWSKSFYAYLMALGEKSDKFQRELNKLKLLKGPLL